MEFKRNGLIAVVIILISLIGFISMAIFVRNERINRFDQMVIDFIRGGEADAWTPVMKFFSFVGSFPIVVIIFLVTSFILYRLLRSRVDAFFLAFVLIGGQMLNQLLKMIFQRARPDVNLLVEVSGYSFPSGHAMGAFILYGILTFLFWRHLPHRFGRMAIVLFSSIFILIIGVSRIYLGVHYPSDIIGGYLVSAAWLTIAIWFFQRYKEKQYERNNVYKGSY